MADVLVKFDQARFNAMLAATQRVGENILQPLVDQFNALGVGDLAPNELHSLLNSPIDLIYDKMTNGDQPQLAGVNVIKAKAIELLVKPNGYEAFLNAVQEVNAALKSGDGYSFNGFAGVILPHRITDWYEIDEDGQVSVTSSMNDKLDAQNRYYAKTDAAKTMFQFAQDLATLLNTNDITKAMSSVAGNVQDELRKFCLRKNSNTNEIEIIPEEVLRYNSDAYYTNPALG